MPSSIYTPCHTPSFIIVPYHSARLPSHPHPNYLPPRSRPSASTCLVVPPSPILITLHHHCLTRTSSISQIRSRPVRLPFNMTAVLMSSRSKHDANISSTQQAPLSGSPHVSDRHAGAYLGFGQKSYCRDLFAPDFLVDSSTVSAATDTGLVFDIHHQHQSQQPNVNPEHHGSYRGPHSGTTTL